MNIAWIIGHVFIGLSIILVPQFFVRSIPESRNQVFGYRTKRSMSSPEAWKEGNEYAAKFLVRVSWLLVTIQVVSCFAFTLENALLVTIACWVTALILCIVFTEIHLKQKFS